MGELRSGRPGRSNVSTPPLFTTYRQWRVEERLIGPDGKESWIETIKTPVFDLDDAVSLFRKAGSIFEGHVERTVPGVEWTTGCAGQGPDRVPRSQLQADR